VCGGWCGHGGILCDVQTRAVKGEVVDQEVDKSVCPH